MQQSYTLKKACLFLLIMGFIPFVALAQRSDERIRVQVNKMKNGEKIQIEEDIPAAEGEDLENLLKKYGVEEELGEIKPGEEVEITIRRKNTETSDDMVIKMDREKMNTPERRTISRAFLGVHYEMIYGRTSGSHVNTVVKETPASRAGLRTNDIITKVDGERLHVLEDLARIVQRHKPGDKVMLSVIRDGGIKTIPVILGERKEHFFSPGNGDTGYNYELDFDKLAPGMKLNASAARPFLGVTFMRTESNVVINGEEVHRSSGAADLEVSEVLPNSTAQAMGLQPGDRITAINGDRVATFEGLTAKLKTLNVGDNILLEFDREGQAALAGGRLNPRPDNLKQELEIIRYGRPGGDIEIEEEVAMDGSIHNRVRTLLTRLENEQKGGQVVREYSIVIRMDEVSEQEAQSLSEKSGQPFVANGALAVGDLKLSPNPNNGRFSVNFNLPNPGQAEMRVVDANGRPVYAETLRAANGRYRKDFDISTQAKGIYYMQITQGGKSFSRKIVSQ